MTRPLTFGITGARGFIGSELTRLLRSHGHRVVPLSRTKPDGEDRFVPFELGEAPPVESLRDLDVLVHGAYDFRCRDAAEHRRKNIDGSIALFSQAKAAGVSRMVFLSSLSAFPGCRSAYGRGKMEVENAAIGLGAIALRLGLVYSDGDGGLSGSLRKLVRVAKIIPLPGTGGQPLFPLSTDDLATALVRLVAQPIPVGRVVPLAQNKPIAFREILRDLARQEGKAVVLVPFPWQVMWAGLKTLELLGLKINFRSDSLVSLVNGDPSPDLHEAVALGVSGGDDFGRPMVAFGS